MYPIQELPPTATEEDKMAAVQSTLQMMMEEGMSQEEAQQKIMQMVQAMGSMSTRSPQMMRSTMGGYASDGASNSGQGGEGYRSQQGMNRRFTNWNPTTLPPGGGSPGYQRY